MSTNIISKSQSLAQIYLKYKQLPYVAIKKNSRWFIIPHKPKKPKMLHFNVATNAIKQHSLKYNQYFSSQKLWQKVLQKFKQKMSDYDPKKQMFNQQQFRKQWDQYQKKFIEYEQKYKQPFRMLAVNSYCLFKREFFAKIKEQKVKQKAQQAQKEQNLIQNEKNENKEDSQQNENQKNKDKQNLKEKKKSKVKSNSKKQKTQIYPSLSIINGFKVNQVWLKMSPQQKKVYEDKLEQMMSQNGIKIKEFIRNHQVPKVSKYSTIGRFISKYSPIYQINLNNPQLYKKYRQLPQQQKKQLKQQAVKLNAQGKKRMDEFLLRWNISKQQLKYILDVSSEYIKTRKSTLKEYKKELTRANKEKQLAIDQQFEDYEDEDFDMQNQQEQHLTNNDNQQDK